MGKNIEIRKHPIQNLKKKGTNQKNPNVEIKEDDEKKEDMTKILEMAQKTEFEINRKFRDEVFYSINMLLSYIATAILFSKPNYFHYFNTFVNVIFILHRIFEYLFYKWHFYLSDFCYVVDFSIIAFSCFYQENFEFFLSCFGFAMGFVLYGIYFYRYGIIFHNTVKMTSVWTHYPPAITMFIFRWYNNQINQKANLFLFGQGQNNFSVLQQSSVSDAVLNTISQADFEFSIPCVANLLKNIASSLDIWNLSYFNLTCYLVYFKNLLYIYLPWFIFYYLINFQIFYQYILKKNYENQFMIFFNKKDKRLVNFGSTMQGFIYMFFHFLYIFVLSSISFLFLYSYHLGLIVLLICMLSMIIKSSTYYIEYFSREYQKQFYPKNISKKMAPV